MRKRERSERKWKTNFQKRENGMLFHFKEEN